MGGFCYIRQACGGRFIFCCFEIVDMNFTRIVHDILIEGLTHGFVLFCLGIVSSRILLQVVG